MIPLDYPPVWPPPELPPLQNDFWAMRVPVLGRLVALWMYCFRIEDQIEQVWGPIEDNIVKQLESRPSLIERDQPSRQEQIVSILAAAVCFEKGIDPVRQLHPDDPVILLVWGSYDDLTILIFRMNLLEAMGIEFMEETAEKFVETLRIEFTRETKGKVCNPGMTVADLVELLLNQKPVSKKPVRRTPLSWLRGRFS